ncbi:MAG: hypothetical protein LUD17_09155 [Bacteroidales bacterium]|nr:hypothetical protein [Bacteroidales bacterium]
MALSRLNGQLDKCYDLLYEAYPTVTEADYEKIRPYLQILLTTISELIETYSVSPLSLSLADGVERLRRNYSALYEINSDIQNFRIKIHKNPRFHAAMAQLKEQSN